MSKPRDRSNRLPRRNGIFPIIREHVGRDEMEETCSRCGWPCTHLVKSYYESPWNQYGGICSQCVQEAVRVYDSKGWPSDPRVEPEKPKVTETVERLELFEK